LARACDKRCRSPRIRHHGDALPPHREPLFLDDRLVELGDGAGELGEVERLGEIGERTPASASAMLSSALKVASMRSASPIAVRIASAWADLSPGASRASSSRARKRASGVFR